MRFRREQYLELMTFGRTDRQMFVELFGPLVGLEDEWRRQGATRSLSHVDLGRELLNLPPRLPHSRGWQRMAF